MHDLRQEPRPLPYGRLREGAPDAGIPGGSARDPPDRVVQLFGAAGTIHSATEKRGFMRWLADHDVRLMMELLRPAPGLVALDAGCGTGAHARLLKGAGMTVVAVDKTPRMVDLVRPHVDEAHLADLEHLALGRTFDRILCFGVLDYVDDVARCFESLARHLGPGGRLVVQVPRCSLGGIAYRLAYRLRSGITPRLFHWGALDEEARRHGLELEARAHPFVHSLDVAWVRPARGSQAIQRWRVED